MKGYRMNPDADYVRMIVEGIAGKNGHCPCRADTGPHTLCPCDAFVACGDCHCRLFVPAED